MILPLVMVIVGVIMLIIGTLYCIVIASKDLDGKEDRSEYWESFRRQRWEEELRKEGKND